MLHLSHLAVLQKIHRVIQVFSLHHRVPAGRADDDGDTLRGQGQASDRLFGEVEKIVDFAKVARRISAGGQFAEANEVGALRLGVGYRAEHLLDVAVEVADVEVELGNGDLHAGYWFLDTGC